MRILGRAFPIAHSWWQGAEADLGYPSRNQLGELDLAFSKWSELVNDRIRKLEMAQTLAPAWLSRTPDRLPCVVPVEIENESKISVRELSLSSGMRHIQAIDAEQSKLVKVFPLPVHQDINMGTLQKVIRKLSPMRRP